MKAACIVLIALLVFLYGCSPKIGMGEVSGVYAMNNNGGMDCLELYKNGTYKHEFVQGGVHKGKQFGSWNIEDFQAGRTVVLSGFEALSGEKTTGAGFYLLLIDNTWLGTTKLITNIDTDDGYVKAADCGSMRKAGAA
jgi:hypothetical protein